MAARATNLGLVNIMEKQHCIVVGASHAGTSLALQLRREGWDGDITLVSNETELPYHRPPLSKEYLSGKKELTAMLLRPEKVFADNKIELMLDTEITGLDCAEKTITVANDSVLNYDKLALCTGASPIPLPMGMTLGGVHMIRSVADVNPIKSRLADARSAVIIGAGYIGLEAAAVLSEHGLDVTVLEMADRILARVTSTTMSDYMESLHESHGVKILKSTKVISLEGTDSVEEVVCEGGHRFPADLVIVGIGVRPNIALAEMANLAVDNGILVDDRGRTSNSDVYAAGDCSNHPSALYDKHLRLESVQNANDQGRVVAANICGKDKVYDAVPWFWSDQYDVKLQMVGLSQGFDKVVIRGDVSDAASEGFALFYFQGARLIAADCIGRPKEFMASKQLVMTKAEIDPSILMDESIEPASFLT